MTKRSPVVRDRELGKQTSPRRGGRRMGRVGKRGRGKNGGYELVPLVEKLKPGQLKAGRGGRGGRRGAKSKGLSPKRATQRKATILAVPCEEDEVCRVRGEGCGVMGEVCEVGVVEKESESKLGDSEVEDRGSGRKEETVLVEGDGMEERGEEKKQETELPIAVHVPQLRRSQATILTFEAMLSKDSEVKDISSVGSRVSDSERGQCGIPDTTTVKPLTETAALKRKRGRPRKTPRQNERAPTLQSSIVSRSSTQEEVDAALYSVPTPTELHVIGGHVPKLRRSHATAVTLEAMLSKDIAAQSAKETDVVVPGNEQPQWGVLDTSTAKLLEEGIEKPLDERTGLKRKRGRPRKTPQQDEHAPTPLSSSTESSSSTREEVDAALYTVPTPTELSTLTQLLTVPVATTTNLSLETLTSDTALEPAAATDETTQTREVGEEYPQPSTNYQKMQRRLAREKQLSEMRARDMVMEREQRYLRRQGLLEPEKKGVEGQRRVKWKEEKELVEVFCYSPCSSRGSTLEPDEIPDIIDPT